VIDRLVSTGGDQLRLLWFDGPFNFSAKVNAGVEAARGDFICLLNDDVEVIAADWLETMVGLAREADCGLVGCKLLFGDGTLQHGGHVYVDGSMLHAYTHFRGTDPGMANLLGVTRECAGVTAACAVLRREVWDEVGGMWEELPVNYNDVDFSLKIRSLGYRVVWTPHAVLYHHESSTRAPGTSPAETLNIHRRWGQELACDPYFNPNLDKTRADWVVAKAPEAWIT
jgi:GT2 family glycosyltransferase